MKSTSTGGPVTETFPRSLGAVSEPTTEPSSGVQDT